MSEFIYLLLIILRDDLLSTWHRWRWSNIPLYRMVQEGRSYKILSIIMLSDLVCTTKSNRVGGASIMCLPQCAFYIVLSRYNLEANSMAWWRHMIGVYLYWHCYSCCFWIWYVSVGVGVGVCICHRHRHSVIADIGR